MQSLYGRLFKYRDRPDRSPLEDYLSECLSDFFNRLPLTEQIGFISRLFLPTFALSEWRSLTEATANIRMETQYPIVDGRLDIAVLFDREPVLVIENKIRSPIGKRPDNTDQLTYYGQWLRQKVDAAGLNLAVLCLLTHATRPPETFSELHTDLYGSIPKVVRWSEIASELGRLAEKESLRWDARSFAQEFYKFLLEQDMASEAPRLQDFAAAIVYVQAGSRISTAFEEVFDHLSTIGGIFARGSITHDLSLEFDSNNNLIQGWKYLSASPLKTAYFAYGISLQPRKSLQVEMDHSRGLLPDEDSIFLCFGVESKKEIKLLEKHAKMLGHHWQYFPMAGYSIVATFQPFKTVLSEPQAFASTLMSWIDQVKPEIMPLVSAMQSASVS